MTRRDRLMSTLRGETVDRPPVCFYEISGFDEHPEDPNPFNIFSDPSWLPLIELARDKTDRIVLRSVLFEGAMPDAVAELTTTESTIRDGSRFSISTVKAAGRTLTSRTRQDPSIKTVWTEEHLLKDVEDMSAFMDLPSPQFSGTPRTDTVVQAEEALGDTGIVMIDTPDPLCCAAPLFSMENFTIIALTEERLFRQLLDRFADPLLERTEAIAKALPGRLWRIFGPEYASPPYLPPRLFREYVVRYVTPMVESIQRYGGFARIHSHGKLRDILDDIAGTGCVGLDPIEPPPQGDVHLSYVREHYGEQMVLFGNLEVSDIEIMPTDQFAEKVKTALSEGTHGKGRGMVLMPSASPYGRQLADLSLKNYEKIIELVEQF